MKGAANALASGLDVPKRYHGMRSNVAYMAALERLEKPGIRGWLHQPAKVKAAIAGKQIVKKIYVPSKMVNLVVR